jgi:hypothetical protein
MVTVAFFFDVAFFFVQVQHDALAHAAGGRALV